MYDHFEPAKTAKNRSQKRKIIINNYLAGFLSMVGS
jgi:hypothetical protein